MAGRDDLVGEGVPVVRPFLLKDRDEDQVEFVEEGSLRSECFFRAGGLDDEVYHEVADS